MGEKTENGIPKMTIEEGSPTHKFVTGLYIARDVLVAIAPVIVTWILTKGKTASTTG